MGAMAGSPLWHWTKVYGWVRTEPVESSTVRQRVPAQRSRQPLPVRPSQPHPYRSSVRRHHQFLTSAVGVVIVEDTPLGLTRRQPALHRDAGERRQDAPVGQFLDRSHAAPRFAVTAQAAQHRVCFGTAVGAWRADAGPGQLGKIDRAGAGTCQGFEASGSYAA